MKTKGTWVGALAAAFVLSGTAAAQEKFLTEATYAPQEFAKAANTETVASRGAVSPSNTIFGGFTLASSTTVYILVRGNSLGSLGVTQAYLDAPRARLFNQAGQDLVSDGNGRPGFNGCLTTNTTTDLPVINYYATRGAVQSRDSCIAVVLGAGVYTFSVTPSIPGATTTSTASSPANGEVLFEVTLGPAGTAVDNNRTRTERLVGGTWTFLYTIISTFSERYSFTSVTASTTTAGDYVALGTDQFGDLVIGSYSSALQLWGVLDQSILLDRFFTFTFTDNNTVRGCYYQIVPPGSSNLGTCYSMNGTRFPPKAGAAANVPADPSRELAEAAMAGGGTDADPRVVKTYLEARAEAEKRRRAP